MATTAVVPASHVPWLKKIGSAIYTGMKDVVGLLGNQKIQAAEAQVANVASLLLPAEAPLIQGFQTIMGKIFTQTAVTETAMTNIANSGAQKLSAVVSAIEPELDTWVENNFPGSAKVSTELKAGLVSAIVNLQNAITVPAAPAAPATSAAATATHAAS